ncbi:MAG TPA: pirin family protein [Chloroflexota bacterium]|nr:pirin family protein [Chloroflexota bacterium]
MSAQAQTQAQTPSQVQPREAALVADSHVVLEGGGIPVTRALPTRGVTYERVDPWLMLDEGKLESLPPGGFPPHPHRGFEILTYIVEGAFSQEDDKGNSSGEVRAGGLLRTTAGRGMWHGEGGGGLAGPLRALQLWINLPRAQKQIPPSVQAVQAEQIPEQTIGDARVRVLVGEGSPTEVKRPALYLDATLPAGGTTDLSVPAGFQGFAFLLDGSGAFGSNALQAQQRQVVLLGAAGQAGQSGGETTFAVRAGTNGVRFVLAAGQPIGETPRWNGPYVD